MQNVKGKCQVCDIVTFFICCFNHEVLPGVTFFHTRCNFIPQCFATWGNNHCEPWWVSRHNGPIHRSPTDDSIRENGFSKCCQLLATNHGIGCVPCILKIPIISQCPSYITLLFTGRFEQNSRGPAGAQHSPVRRRTIYIPSCGFRRVLKLTSPVRVYGSLTVHP